MLPTKTLMKRSTINAAINQAKDIFATQGWHLPPQPRWDVTDFGLGQWEQYGLLLVNLAEEVEYCEKLMIAQAGQITPAHYHKKKKEDIIARAGSFAIRLWATNPREASGPDVMVKINGAEQAVKHGETIVIPAGQRITLVPGVWHEFWAQGGYCVIGEVSTANDDLNDNFFDREDIGRYAEIDEDVPAVVKLVSDK